MRTGMLLSFAFVGALIGGFFLIGELGAGAPPDELLIEEVDANLVRIYANGHWEELPLMPLADHLCQGSHRFFEKYCPDTVLAPERQL